MKKNNILTILSLVLIALLGACSVPNWCCWKKKESSSSKAAIAIKTITAEELKSKLEEKKTNLLVINVLDQKYFDDCHIKGSINIPLADLSKKAEDFKDKEIVVYCASTQCPASVQAFNQLTSLGCKDVKAYEGGMKEWYNKGFPSEGPAELDYLR